MEDEFPCQPSSVFTSVEVFKKTLQDYAMKQGFMFITGKSYQCSYSNDYRLQMSCMCSGKPRSYRHNRNNNNQIKRRQIVRQSLKIGCQCKIEATICESREGIVIVDKCNWNHTNGCIPSPHLLNLFHSRSGYYYKSLSLYNKLRFKRLVELGRSNEFLLCFIKSILPPNAIVSFQTVTNWKMNIMYSKVLVFKISFLLYLFFFFSTDTRFKNCL